ncbi:MAG: hypothetical protein CMK00_00920 [Planctomycetes bacterium]|nr:hypothetical protein [Planctomycetota bacterium]
MKSMPTTKLIGALALVVPGLSSFPAIAQHARGGEVRSIGMGRYPKEATPEPASVALGPATGAVFLFAGRRCSSV